MGGPALLVSGGLPVLLVIASVAAPAATGPPERPPALLLPAADDECLTAPGGGGDGCALSAVQLRGLQVQGAASSTPPPPAPAAWGGDAGKGHGKALVYRPVPSDCRSFGCGGAGAVVPGRECQCSADCGAHGSCCADHAATCAGHGAGGRPGGFLSMIPYARSGVNLGGWFVLEDWFFSGTAGTHVMSVSEGQGACLPPLLRSAGGERWPSEGVLVKRLVASRGPEEAVKIMEAHRDTYVTEADFAQAAKLGISKVRLPIPWYAFADALAPLDAKVYAPGARIVPDPFYSTEASFVTVDRSRIAKALDMAAAHGLKVVLDIHNSPGGAQDGTYNGVWPMKPQFWLSSSRVGKPTPLTETGLWVAAALIRWVEALPPAQLAAVDGVTLMNEPAHMASIDAGKGKGFIRSEQQVWDWIARSSDLFRQSSLPRRGKRLYVSLVETTWADPYSQMPIHWARMFSAQERHAWAVFDVHWYIAWSGDLCSGRAGPGGQFTCDMPVDELRPLLRNCAVHDMVRFFRQVDGLKAVSEWSLGTFEQPQEACHSPALLHAFLEEQLDVYRMYDIEPFFWNWNLPYGRNFQSAWSLKYIAGQEPATPAGACG